MPCERKTMMESFYKDMSQESPADRKSSILTQDNTEHKVSEISVETKRKVSNVPPLKKISEEEDDDTSKDEKIKILEKKLSAIQSSLQKLQELVATIDRSEITPDITAL